MRNVIPVARLCVLILGFLLASSCGRKSEPPASHDVSTPVPVDFSKYAPGFKTEVDAQLALLETNPEDKEALLHLANLYMANRRHPRARLYYIRYLDTTGGSDQPRVHYYLARIAMAEGRSREALEHLRQVLDRSPDYVPAYLALGDVLYKSGRPGEARPVYEEALELDPENPHVTLALVQDALRTGNRDRAIQYLEGTLQAHPHFSEGLTLLAKLLDEAGESGRAQRLLEQDRYGWDLPPADPWMEGLISLCYDPQILGFYFEDHRRVGEVGKSLDYLSRMETIDPRNPMPHLLRGNLFYELERRAEAERELKQAIEKGADPGLAHTQLLKTLIELGKLDEAERIARDGLAMDPKVPLLHVSLAGLEIQKENFDQALNHFDRAFRLDPTDPFVCRMLANLCRRQDQPSRALDPLERWLLIEPDNLEAATTLAETYLELNQGARALETLELARRRHPENKQLADRYLQTTEQLGHDAFEQEDYASAIAYFSKAIEAGSESLTLFGVKTQSHIRLGQWQAAEDTVLAVIERHPRVALFYANLGDIQNAAGRREDAMTSWRIAKSLLTPNDPIELRQKLDLKLGE